MIAAAVQLKEERGVDQRIILPCVVLEVHLDVDVVVVADLQEEKEMESALIGRLAFMNMCALSMSFSKTSIHHHMKLTCVC